MKPNLVRVRNPYQPIGLRGRKMYVLRGHGFMSNLFSGLKSVGKAFGKSIISSAPKVLTSVAKEVAPIALTYGASKLGELAAKKGVPDELINLGANLAQAGAKKISNIKTDEKLTGNEKMVKDFVTNQSQNLLANILSQGSGVRGLGVRNIGGNGVYNVSHVGNGVRGLGVRGLGIEAMEAPRI